MTSFDSNINIKSCLREKFPTLIFSETFTTVRSRVSYVRNVKKKKKKKKKKEDRPKSLLANEATVSVSPKIFQLSL